MMRFFASLPGFLFPALLTAQAFSSSAQWGPDTWARAGSGVATSFNLDAFEQNPAGLLTYQGASSFGGYWLNGAFSEDKWAVGVVDGKRQVLGGFLFDWTTQDSVRRMGFHPTVAYRTNYGAFGVSLHVMEFDNLPEAEDDGWFFTQTMGLLVPLGQSLFFGASASSLVDSQPDRVLPPELRLGISYRKEQAFELSFQSDRRFEIPDQDWNYSASATAYAKKFFVIQGGYRWDQTNPDGDLWSVGGGLNAPKLHFLGFYTKRTHVSDDGFGFKLKFLF